MWLCIHVLKTAQVHINITGVKNHTNSDPDGAKIKENRKLERSWALLVRFLRSLVRFGGNFSRSWGEARRKMIEVGARMASNRVLDGP